MLIATIDNIPDKNVEIVGLVRGVIVSSKHIGKDIMASLKEIKGGEIKSYTDMKDAAFDAATERMVKEAQELGADGIVGVRYTAEFVKDATVSICSYGTAVKFVK